MTTMVITEKQDPPRRHISCGSCGLETWFGSRCWNPNCTAREWSFEG